MVDELLEDYPELKKEQYDIRINYLVNKEKFINDIRLNNYKRLARYKDIMLTDRFPSEFGTTYELIRYLKRKEIPDALTPHMEEAHKAYNRSLAALRNL